MILNKTRRARDRFRLVPGGMNYYGFPQEHVNHHWRIAAGTDRGNGYQRYMSIDYFFGLDYVPEEAKELCRQILQGLGFKV